MTSHDNDVKPIKIIQRADKEKVRQSKQYAAVVSERDILGSQLVKRNEELSALYEENQNTKVEHLESGGRIFRAAIK